MLSTFEGLQGDRKPQERHLTGHQGFHTATDAPSNTLKTDEKSHIDETEITAVTP